jgi:hypothetical protein
VASAIAAQSSRRAVMAQQPPPPPPPSHDHVHSATADRAHRQRAARPTRRRRRRQAPTAPAVPEMHVPLHIAHHVQRAGAREALRRQHGGGGGGGGGSLAQRMEARTHRPSWTVADNTARAQELARKRRELFRASFATSGAPASN